MSLSEQQNLEERYVIHSYGRKPLELVEGSGMVVRDSDGRQYLDFLSGIGVCSLGHCHPAVVGAIKKQAERLIHVSNYYYIEQRGEVASLLNDMLNVASLKQDADTWQTFFANSGAEANECAIKLARLYSKLRAAHAGQSEEDIPRLIVTLENSFHGRTLSTLAATAQPAKQDCFAPLPSGFIATPINDIASLEALFAEKGTEICAVMVECVQGESGIHPCEREFLQAIRSLLDAHEALLICDEVQCGVFRCGTYPFAFQHFGITPDIVTIAKGVGSGVPVGMCSARTAVAASFQPGFHGSTFGGSNLAIAAVKATLDTLCSEDIAQEVEKKGDYLRKRLAKLPHVVQVRGLGLMVACDLDEGISAPGIVDSALSCGLLLNACGPMTLRFLPPLICTVSDIDCMIDRLYGLLAG